MTNVTMTSIRNAQVLVDMEPSRVMGTNRWVDIFSPDAFKAQCDFIDEPVAEWDGVSVGARWTTTVIGDSSFLLLPSLGARGLITTGAVSGDGVNAQFGTAGFRPTQNATLSFEARLMVDEASACDLFIGLASVEPDILGVPASDVIGFRKLAASTGVDLVLAKDGNETIQADVFVLDTDTDHVFNFYVDGPGHRVYFYVDQFAMTALSSFTNIPIAANLAPSVAFLTGESVSHGLSIDKIHCFQLGRS